ncbi:type I pullulanase [Paenibacillus sp. DS2015]|uniref:type I pullulanase n=1 Tax=Paenibacillus sp. DS2015 TaxID=3373917 RepID=UPI003D1AB569
MSVQVEQDIAFDYGDLKMTDGISVFDKEFDEVFYYGGNDLGAVYTPDKTIFRLWAPTASEAYVVFYDSWDGTALSIETMTRDVQGTWIYMSLDNCENRYYTFRVKVGKDWSEAVDPYAKAVGINGDRGVVLDMQRTDPEHWKDNRPPFIGPTDAIIYELHLRDLSINPNSGIKHAGKFLGLSESGTYGPEGISTGLDYISNLGVTHVQLLPIYDYATESVDETKLDLPHYNWGYDPKNFNVPEGSYATDPYHPSIRITELKQSVQALHDRGLRVIMDVVYNHVYDGYLVNFTKLVPGYYLRHQANGTFANGSFCGNEFASERSMASKFIVDSVLYWAQEYHIDGFRFDLMGLIDMDTMNEISRRLTLLDPSIIVIAEGWNMDTVLPEAQRANQRNAGGIPHIGLFNDGYRDAIKGDIFLFQEKGFISGEVDFENKIKRGIVGGIQYTAELSQFATEPIQTVNYVECHDNHTLWDKIAISATDASEKLRGSMHRLASAMVLTSQGIPFLHAGQEFMRTKNGIDNSYKSSESINCLDWSRCADHQEDVEYMTRLIELRKSHPAFRMQQAQQIREHLVFEEAPEQSVAYTLRNHAGGDELQHMYVLYNANRDIVSLVLPSIGDWKVHFGKEHVRSMDHGKLVVQGVGMVILAIY